MNYDESEALLTRMSQAWHGKSAFGEEWHNLFRDLDAGRAGTAFIRLRDTEERPPSIAKFKGAYQSIRVETKHEPVCRWCEGTGMVAPEEDAFCTDSIPCDYCEMGSIQGQRIADAAAIPRQPKGFTPGQAANGLEWAKLLKDQFAHSSGTVKARRWSGTLAPKGGAS